MRMKNAARLPLLSCPILVDRQHSQTAAVVWGLVAMLIPAADRTKRGNGSVGAAAGAQGGRDDHENQHHDGYLIRGVAGKVVLVDDEGHPEPFPGRRDRVYGGGSGSSGRGEGVKTAYNKQMLAESSEVRLTSQAFGLIGWIALEWSRIYSYGVLGAF